MKEYIWVSSLVSSLVSSSVSV